MSEVRMAKFETLIEDINSNINWNTKTGGFFSSLSCLVLSSSLMNTCLGLIYDYDKLNEYAKFIMQKSSIIWVTSDNSRWALKHGNLEEFKNSKARIDAAKEFVQYFNNGANASERYKFIFWALMILTVDKTDADAHLSLICDFARMLHITDNELEDIIYVIKIIYKEVTTEYVFKSENIPTIFASTFNLYQNN